MEVPFIQKNVCRNCFGDIETWSVGCANVRKIYIQNCERNKFSHYDNLSANLPRKTARLSFKICAALHKLILITR